MNKIPRIACLSVVSSAERIDASVQLPDGLIRWDVMPVEPEPQAIKGRIDSLLTRYDAVALDGIPLSFKVAGHQYKYEQLWNLLEVERVQHKLNDDSRIQEILDRDLVGQAAKKLSSYFTNKRILFFSGLHRYEAAEVLTRYTSRLVFGDLMYGYRIGIPIHGLQAMVNTAPQLVRVIGQTPLHWYWPGLKSSSPVFPAYHQQINYSDVLIGGMAFFNRYVTTSLKGKVVVTTIRRDEDIELFTKANARYVISLTPRINGILVPQTVLEAGLRLLSAGRAGVDLERYYLNNVNAMGLVPDIFDLAPEETKKSKPVELPVETPKPDAVTAESVEVALEDSDEVGKFCFVIHPLNFEHVARLPIVQAAKYLMPRRAIEDAMAQVPPFPVGKIRNVVSKAGARAEGLIYAIPMTSHAMMRYPPGFLYKRLLTIADEANRRGCRLMGLGAYTSVVGDAGLTVSKRSPIGVTSGNSYTVAATLKTLEVTAERCGINLKESTALVVGATGSIGSICARLLAGMVKKLRLVSPRPERLLSLSRKIEAETPSIQGEVKLARDADHYLSHADVIITTTSAVDPVVDVGMLKPGCIVCDVARPPDIKPEAAAKRDDILVIESGEIRLLPGAECTYDIGLPEGTIYACLAETLLLALDGKFDHYTLGREIEPEKVREMAAIGEKHGFELADIRSFGKIVPAERFERLAEINRARFSHNQQDHTANLGNQ